MENETPDIKHRSIAEVLSAIEVGAKKDASQTPTSESFRKTETDEKQQLELAELNTRQGELEAAFGRVRDIHTARLWGLVLLFLLVVIWLVAILVFVFLSGFQFWPWFNKSFLTLSDAVILALIGSTTVNVIGLFVIAARWLYGAQQETAAGSKD
jgi:hypothetical protein